MRALLDASGDPQRAYPVLHITGTNGKTSTARILSSLLVAAGSRGRLPVAPLLP